MNDRTLCWQDIQKQHATPDDARKAFIKGKTCRIMEVDEKGRRPLP